MRQDLAPQPWLAWLPIGLGDRVLVEHHQSGQSGSNRNGKVRGRQFPQVQLDHHVLGDLTPFRGAVLQPVQPPLHVGDPALEPHSHGLIGQRGPDNGGQDLMQVGQPLDRIGQRLLVDLGFVGFDAIAERAVCGGG